MGPYGSLYALSDRVALTDFLAWCMPSVRTETCQGGGPLRCCVVVGSSEATGFPMMGTFESSVETNLSVAHFSKKLDRGCTITSRTLED